MKKIITLFIFTLLAGMGGVKATTIWEGNSVIGNWAGSSVTVEKESFSGVSAGNIIKVTISAYAETESDNTTAVTYWQYSLGQKDNNWTQLTGFSGDLTKGQKSASYILTETNVTELKTYGLSVNGRYITVTKVELLSTTSENVWNGSVPSGNWETNVTLTYNEKGILANVQKNDYIQMTYTVTNKGAQAAIQNANWNNFISKDDNTYVAEGDNTGKILTLTIEDATTLENIQQNGILLRGKNIIITSADLIKPSNRYDVVPLTIGSEGIATYGSSKNLDFSSISEVTPYYASAVQTGSVTLTSVETTRAWAGYIVVGTAGTYDVPVADSDPGWLDAFSNLRYSGDYNDNWVYRSVYSDYSGEGDDAGKIRTMYRYIFSKNSSGTIGFYKLAKDYSRTVDNTTVYYHLLGAHKAYLETYTDITPTAGVKAVRLNFEDEATGVSSMCSIPSNDDAVYTVTGVRVTQPTRGLYIIGGRKVFIK